MQASKRSKDGSAHAVIELAGEGAGDEEEVLLLKVEQKTGWCLGA